MKNRIRKHIKKNREFECSEIKRLTYKVVYNNRLLQFKYRYKAYKNYLYYYNRIGVSRLKNFCLLSGRSRGVFREFSLSRIEMRNLFNNGKFLGVSKGCW